ncbi:hypothetical protein PIB30_061443 [Stylosanthes scabra]|uniref:Uncharacterized protein n=1 Tax=Stylosanthes scabra TaxID=79078 RepID=A0ABU6RLP9_9FABA|nr:hypothetical protein [Stylosanthes scabra]
MGNKSEVTIARAILIHCIMRGEEVRAEDIIADNMADTGIPLREFRRTSRISEVSYITAKRMESTRIPRNLPQQDQENDDEDEPMPQAGGGNDKEEGQQPQHQNQQPPQQGFPDFQPRYECQYHKDLQGIEEHLSSMQFFQQTFYVNMQKSQMDYMEEVRQSKEKQEEMWNNQNRFQSQFLQEQERLAKEIQEARKSQITQTLVNNKRLETKKNIQQAMEKQGRDIAEMTKQLTLWTRNTSAREAYTCWAHQQANPNLSEIPITQIPDLVQTNAEKGRPIFYGYLKSDYRASTSSQADPQEPVLLRTAPPIPSFQPPHPPPN